jgi:general secretion pathway protein G
MRRSAFTLVELLIVVIILGILAAVVIPQFSDASTDAKVSSLMTNLQTIRGQIDLYKLQHNGVVPVLATFSDQMTKKTDVDGTVNATGKFGPYLQRIPNNPFTIGGTGNDVTNTAAAPSKAWFYDATNIIFKANDAGTTSGVAHDTWYESARAEYPLNRKRTRPGAIETIRFALVVFTHSTDVAVADVECA